MAVMLGDGTLGEGVVYESLNIASLWGLPILFVLENNRYAQTTPIEMNLAGKIGRRFRAFDIETVEMDTTDVLEIRAATAALAAAIRSSGKPRAQVIHTYRLAPHSKGDDFRDAAEIERFRELDPISIIRRKLTAGEWEQARETARREVEGAYRKAESDPWPQASSLAEVRMDAGPAP